jgi:hypothetical protein
MSNLYSGYFIKTYHNLNATDMQFELKHNIGERFLQIKFNSPIDEIGRRDID